MSLIQNTAEGGIVGDTPTVTNTGGASGTALLNDPFIADGDTITISSAAAKHGSRGYRFVYGGGTTATRMPWALSGTARTVFSFYFKINAIPSTSPGEDVAQIGTTSLTNAAEIFINSAGKFAVRASGAGQPGSVSASALTPGTWYHVQLAIKPGTTSSNGYAGIKVSNPDGSTFHTWEASNLNVSTAALNAARIGRATGRPNLSTCDYDTVQADPLAAGNWFPEFASNTSPTVDAGPDATVDPNLVDTFTLNGTASDPDGTIASYLWEDITTTPTVVPGSGASRTLSVPKSPAGTVRTYRLTVTDNGGATAADTVKISILPHTRWAKVAGSLVPVRRTR